MNQNEVQKFTEVHKDLLLIKAFYYDAMAQPQHKVFDFAKAGTFVALSRHPVGAPRGVKW